MSKQPLSTGRRLAETRTPRVVFVKSDLSFSFKYFYDQDGAGQSLKTWLDTEPLLVQGLLDKLIFLSSNNLTAVQQNKILTLYQQFPAKKQTDFSCIAGFENENWGTIRKLNGQQGRAAGFLRDNVFYIVHLDKDHRFWKSSRR